MADDAMLLQSSSSTGSRIISSSIRSGRQSTPLADMNIVGAVSRMNSSGLVRMLCTHNKQ
jgi:hypothetical protein